jgi:two-component system LytT family response regulator
MPEPKRLPRAVIVDDEPLARLAMRDLLVADGRVVIVGEAGNGREAIELITETVPELVFLDIRMPGLDGFAVIDRLREILASAAMPEVVFVTAFAAFALRAFDAHALDYLLKPTDERRLAESLDRAIARLAERRTAERVRAAVLKGGAVQELPPHSPATDSPLARIAVTSGNRVVFIQADEIDWIEARSYYARLHLGPTSHLVRESMNNLEQRLDPRIFARIHRSTIVNISRIVSVEPLDRRSMRVLLKSGERLILSRRRRRQLAHLFA